MRKYLRILNNCRIFASEIIKKEIMKTKRNNNGEDFKTRVKKAMDLMMYQSVSKSMAIAACATSFQEANEMMKYINENL